MGRQASEKWIAPEIAVARITGGKTVMDYGQTMLHGRFPDGVQVGMIQRKIQWQMREHADRPALGSPGVNLFDRIFDGSSGCHDERFESSGVRAAVIVQEPMIRLDKA